MKILYIRRKPALISGGSRCQDANREMLNRIAGISNVFEYRKGEYTKNRFQRNLNRLFIGRYNDFTLWDFLSICSIIKKERIEILFFDGSRIGYLAKKIKNRFPHLKVITFFHNVEYQYVLNVISRLSTYKRLLAQIDLKNVYCGEKSACEVSDIIISLNDRDAVMIQEKYGRYPDAVFPISLKDNFDSKYLFPHNHNIPIGLMVGSNFPPNANGLDWFIRKVLPFVKMKLYVIGSGMDSLLSKYSDVKNLEIIGYVDDLKEYYAKADFMIMPIFEGSGMKVKTAEALEYGKIIIAAPEAAVGYTYTDEIKVCKNAEEFIKTITSLKFAPDWNGFMQSSRDIFMKYYSYEALENNYKNLLSRFNYI